MQFSGDLAAVMGLVIEHLHRETGGRNVGPLAGPWAWKGSGPSILFNGVGEVDKTLVERLARNDQIFEIHVQDIIR